MNIDNLSPGQRPPETPRGYQRWRSLLFLHWPLPEEALRRAVPAPLELDLLDGVAYVGIVPFAMEGVRPRWWPEAMGFRFLETNVRTYVTYRGVPGIYFFSLEAAMRPAVWAARTFWGLPYFHASMAMETQHAEVRYRSQRRRTGEIHQVHYRIGEHLGPSEPGTPEFFLLERYYLFLEHRGVLFRAQVHHVPYPAQRAEVIAVQDELVAAAGLPSVVGGPTFAHYSPGVDVEVFSLRRC